MIVEDDPSLREVLCRVVQSNGFTPLACSSAASAFEALKASRPVALMVDWELGEGRNGVDVARVAAACPWKPAIVMITGSNLARLRERTRQLPVRAYLQKPFSRASIDRLLRRLRDGDTPR